MQIPSSGSEFQPAKPHDIHHETPQKLIAAFLLYTFNPPPAHLIKSLIKLTDCPSS